MFDDELSIALHAIGLQMDEYECDYVDIMDIEGLCVSYDEGYEYDTVPQSLAFD